MKIFKKLLPVVIGLSLIIVIAITIVIVNATNSKTPKLSNCKRITARSTVMTQVKVV